MASPDGRPVFIKRVPWHEQPMSQGGPDPWKPTRRPVSPPKPLDEPLLVDRTGHFVDSEGEPLSQEDYDNRPKGV